MKRVRMVSDDEMEKLSVDRGPLAPTQVKVRLQEEESYARRSVRQGGHPIP